MVALTDVAAEGTGQFANAYYCGTDPTCTRGALLWSLHKGVGWTTGDTYSPFGFKGQLVAKPGAGFWLLGSFFSAGEVLEPFLP